MEEIVLYHGSNVIVENPEILSNGHYKDFGFEFYCTSIKKQAIRWALTKKGESIINTYNYNSNNNLNVKIFKEMSDEWLEFVVNSRKGIKHDFDIVEGPMADDQIWDYVEDYVEETITKEAFWELVRFKYPTHQIVFCSDDALKTLKYIGSENV